MKDKDRDIAKAIVENSDYVDFITRYLIDKEEIVPDELMSFTDKDAGEFIKTDIRANKKIKARWERVRAMARPQSEAGANSVPE